MKTIAGFDIGGTKCAVVIGQNNGDVKPAILFKEKFATGDWREPECCITHLLEILSGQQQKHPEWEIESLGISCGGPLDPVRGVIQSPPNLPGWDDIPITRICEARLQIPARLQNDANACALAEWKFGAGRGCTNMIFLTFGTGLGAGIIVNGAILNGASGMAGECGHIRLAPDGPAGYHKHGSFEGFCSGGGIAQMGRTLAAKVLRENHTLPWCHDEIELESITAYSIAKAAEAGDVSALSIYSECGSKLGEGLSILIDLLNPERIVIGSIFARSELLLRKSMEEVINREALEQSRNACRIIPAELGESLGDIAALTAGLK